MESEEESIRLDAKTDPESVRQQATWCGVRPGMRVLDLACGSGKTTSVLHDMVAPDGSIIGVDYSDKRLAYARAHYGKCKRIEFVNRDLTKPIDDLGMFDIVWVRFILEYFREESRDIVSQLRSLVKPGGHLCLIDLDNNCLSHHELPVSMALILPKLMASLDEQYNFDTFAGRKLYSYLYDERYESIEMAMMAHHLIYGEARPEDVFNWLKKIEIAAAKLETLFIDYPGGAQTFIQDFKTFFLNPRRFTYTPLIMAKGMRPFEEVAD